MTEYLTRKELAARLKHSEVYIAHWTDDMVEGVHYVHLRGSRKYLYIWSAVEALIYT